MASPDSPQPETRTSLPSPVQDVTDALSQDNVSQAVVVYRPSTKPQRSDELIQASLPVTTELNDTPDVQYHNRFAFTGNYTVYTIILLPLTFVAYVSTIWNPDRMSVNKEPLEDHSSITTLVRLSSFFCLGNAPSKLVFEADRCCSSP